MKHAALALALGALSMPAVVHAHEQTTAAAATPGNSLLTITAEGRSARKPELAVFNAGVTSSGKTAAEALSANSTDMVRVMAALRRAGIAERDIQTSNLSLNPVYAQQSPLPNGEYDPPRPKVVAYQVSNMVTVRQRNLAEYGRVIDTLVSVGANQVNGPSFQVDDSEAAMNEARSDAMAKALARATLYAHAAGLKVAGIQSISEVGGYLQQPPVIFARAAMADSTTMPPMAAGELSMRASVTVLFELKP